MSGIGRRIRELNDFPALQCGVPYRRLVFELDTFQAEVNVATACRRTITFGNVWMAIQSFDVRGGYFAIFAAPAFSP
jgi:hypothetical protein